MKLNSCSSVYPDLPSHDAPDLAELMTPPSSMTPSDLEAFLAPPSLLLDYPDLGELMAAPSPYRSLRALGAPAKRFDRKQAIVAADRLPLLMGFSCLWDDEGDRRSIVGYSVSCKGPDGSTFSKFYEPKPGRRFKQSTLLSMVIEDCLAAGVIDKWPSRIILASHFLRPSLTAFDSFWEHKSKYAAQGVSITGTFSTYGVDDNALRSRRAPQRPLILRDRHHHVRKVVVQNIDTMTISPPGSTLSELGDMVGLPLFTVPDRYGADKLSEWLAEDRPEFELYALQRAEIAIRYATELLGFIGQEFSVNSLPRSLGAVGVQVFKRLLKAQGIDYLTAFGFEEVQIERWNPQTGKPITRRELRPTPSRQLFEPFVTNCYLGGRGESFVMGPTIIGVWFDWDLRGAYTVGLCDIRVPDYPSAFTSRNPVDFVGHVMGFACVHFCFPPDTRHPCFPVRTGSYGLRFPLSGTNAYVTAPEIELALSMGAEIEILHGVVIPWLPGSPRLFEPFTRLIQTGRQKFSKKSMSEVIIKLIGNTLYGKLAQGLVGKTAFDAAVGVSKKIGPSAVTNPFMAAHATGLIRAVIGELLHRLPAHRTVVSVTTDGFLTDAPLEDLDQSGPLCRRYQELCQLIHGREDGEDVPMLELKHHARQIVSIKTRGQITAIKGNTDPVLAKAGVKFHGTKDEQNAGILELYLNREPGQKVDASHAISLREQWVDERDFVKIKKSVLLNYEFDHKRQLVNPRMVSVSGVQHLACDTVPWATAADADHCRARFDGWRETNCLKTMEDWASWEDYYESALALQGSKIRVREDGSLGILTRILTRSLVQKAWFAHSMTYGEISALLTSVGLPVTVDTCKNSKRTALPENVVPVTGEVLRVLALLLRQLPGYPLEPLFKPERLVEVKRRLAEVEITHD